MRALSLAMLLFVITMPLTSCLNVASSGAQAVYNHRSLQNSVSDQYITIVAYQRIGKKKGEFDNANITISTCNGEVLLAGQVPEEWQKARAEEIVKEIPNVTRVYNQIRIASPSSALTRVSDAWLTTKVKSKLIANIDLDATQIKVVTENGVVYLMGTLKPEEANEAVYIASNTKGVLGVVKMFSYMHITKTMVLQS